MLCPVSNYKVIFFGKFKNSIYYFKRDLNNSLFFFKEPCGLLIYIEAGNVRKNQTYRGIKHQTKNQTYRGKGGDFFHILMLDRLGYN